MQKILFMDKYPLYVFEIEKNECDFKNSQEIAKVIKEKIDTHKVATFIAMFDHYAHTKSLEEGKVAAEIEAAIDIVFCFGKELLKAEAVGVRPRSIGVCETKEKFIISFMEAPNEVANNAMIEWVKSLVNKA